MKNNSTTIGFRIIIDNNMVQKRDVERNNEVRKIKF